MTVKQTPAGPFISLIDEKTGKPIPSRMEPLCCNEDGEHWICPLETDRAKMEYDCGHVLNFPSRVLESLEKIYDGYCPICLDSTMVIVERK